MPHVMLCMRPLLVLASLCLLSGCGGGKAVRPDAPTAAGATGRSSVQPSDGPSAPLVVDWKSEQRADLEEAVHDGVAVVAWDDKGFRLLKRCKLAGDYGYLPIQVKKDVLRLQSEDEVQANLPLGGLGIAGKIGGGFAQGTTLDIAMAMVGKRRTVLTEVKQSELSGDCKDSTHYVRALVVGAFAMKTGTKASAQGTAEIFGAAMGGKSGSSQDVATTDGDLAECEKATGDETKPVGKCAAILRLELEPISRGAKARKADNETLPQCPSGMSFSGNACVKTRADAPRLCNEMDGPDCQQQCSAGDARSCWRYGYYLFKAKSDLRGAIGAYDKSCRDSFGQGCAELAVMQELNKDMPSAVRSAEKGCALGSVIGCRVLGDFYARGSAGAKDPAKAARLYLRACEGGDAYSCVELGVMYERGVGVPADRTRAQFYSRRGCSSGDKLGCDNARRMK